MLFTASSKFDFIELVRKFARCQFLASLTVFATLFSNCIAAQSQDINSYKQGLANAEFLEVFLVKHSTSYIVRLTENDLIKFGCQYSVTDKKDVSEIVSNILNAEFFEKSTENEKFDIRMILVFGAQNKPNIELKFGRAFSSTKFVDGSFGDIRFNADISLDSRIRDWIMTRAVRLRDCF